jgi:hypothetical protein
MAVRSRSAWLLWAALMAACRAEGGDLSVAQLTDVVAREQESLEACYQNALDQTPYDHEFRIETRLRIRPDGSVSRVSFDQTGLKGIGPCVEKTIRAWKFPVAKAETRASLPIIFRPKVEKTLPADLQLPPGFKVLKQPQ